MFFEVQEKQLLEGNIYWDALHHSFDQRNSEVYYVVTYYEKKDEEFEVVKRFGISFGDYWQHTSQSEEEFYKGNLESLAIAGKTNIPKNILWWGPAWKKSDFTH